MCDYEDFVKSSRERLAQQKRALVWTENKKLPLEWLRELIGKVNIYRNHLPLKLPPGLIPFLNYGDPVAYMIWKARDYIESAIKVLLEVNHFYSFGQFCRAAYTILVISADETTRLFNGIISHWDEECKSIRDKLVPTEDVVLPTAEDYRELLEETRHEFLEVVGFFNGHISLLNQAVKRAEETFLLSDNPTYTLDKIIDNQTAVIHKGVIDGACGPIREAIRDLVREKERFEKSIAVLTSEIDANSSPMKAWANAGCQACVDITQPTVESVNALYRNPDLSKALTYFGARNPEGTPRVTELIEMQQRFLALQRRLEGLNVRHAEVEALIATAERNRNLDRDVIKLDRDMYKLVSSIAHVVRMSYRDALLRMALTL